jgi:glycine hydroxymethyltransferase
MGEAEMREIGRLLGAVLAQEGQAGEGAESRRVRDAVVELTGRYPPYPPQPAP